jgi:hypothetical protein
MDPEATLTLIREALDEGDTATVDEHISYLSAHIKRGGFIPDEAQYLPAALRDAGLPVTALHVFDLLVKYGTPELEADVRDSARLIGWRP